MKRIIFFCLLTLAMGACTRLEPATTNNTQNVDNTYCYTFSLGESSKAALGTKAFAWESGDKMGYFAGTTANGSSSIAVGSSSTPSRFTVTSSSAIAAGSKIYCYYPWSSTTGSNPASVTMRIPSCQIQPGNNYDADAMPQAGLPYLVAANLPSGSTLDVMPMCNLGAILRFDVLSSDASLAGIPIYSVSLDSNESGLSGSFTFDLTAVKYYDASTLAISGLGGKSVETQVSGLTTSDSAVSVWMVVAPGTFSGTVKVMTKRGIYAFALSSHTFTRNTVKPFTLDLANAGTVWHRMVETVAGSGTQGTTDGTGTAAKLDIPQGMELGPDGLIWFTQRGNIHAIRTFDPSTQTVATLANHNSYAFIGKHPWNGSFNSQGEYWFCLKSATAAPIVGKINGSTKAVSEISDIGVPGSPYTSNQMAVQFDTNDNLYVMWRLGKNDGGSKIRKFEGSSPSTYSEWTVPSYLGTMALSNDKSWLIYGSESATATQSYLFSSGLDGSDITAIAGTGNGHTTLDSFTDGDAGNPLTATLGCIEGIWMDAQGWIWWSESNESGDNKYSLIRVLIPNEGGDYAHGTVHTMAGVPYSIGTTNGTADVATMKRNNGICGYDGDIYVAEGAGANCIARIFLEEQ